MSTKTQYNPNQSLNERLIAAGCSKTVYAMVTPETEAAKRTALGYSNPADQEAFMDQFREAWTGKQDAYHREFFDEWHAWSSPVIDLDRDLFPFTYPTAGASEPLRQIIYRLGLRGGNLHVFRGEYEGYKAIGEAVDEELRSTEQGSLTVIEWDRSDLSAIYESFKDSRDLFFISQPSAIDGMVWRDFNEFVSRMPNNSIAADVTYVGAVPRSAVREKFNLNAPSIHSVVFSLSKPFGAYYDRIGGVFMRTQDGGLFGNMWFKSLTALSIGRELMRRHTVFDIPERYTSAQIMMCRQAHKLLGLKLIPSHVFILGTGTTDTTDRDGELQRYLTRAGKLRVCLTPGMVKMVGAAK